MVLRSSYANRQSFQPKNVKLFLYKPLEFGVELGGEAGVPYVTKGTAKSNMKITVECSFPKENK
jgi:hypothetical protein